jgi:SAM-dependent methyltransferase
MWNWMQNEIVDSRHERSLETFFRGLSADKKSLRVLDFGCGYGNRAERILQYLGRPAGLFLLDADDNLLQKAMRRTGGQKWIPRKDHFDLIVCFGVLELLTPVQLQMTLQLLADCMDEDSVLAIQNFNWHPLAARGIYWWLRSLGCRQTFASAARTHEQKRFPLDTRGLPGLLREIQRAGLRVTKRILGPYTRSVYLPVPASIRFSVFLECRREHSKA